MTKWGHLKLKSVLSDHCTTVGGDWPVVSQFSSVGSLGPKSDSWLCSEWLLSLSTTKKRGPTALHKYPSLQLVCTISVKFEICVIIVLSNWPSLTINVNANTTVDNSQVFPSVENVRNSLEGYMGE